MTKKYFKNKKRYFDIGGSLGTNFNSIGPLGSGGISGSVGMQGTNGIVNTLSGGQKLLTNLTSGSLGNIVGSPFLTIGNIGGQMIGNAFTSLAGGKESTVGNIYNKVGEGLSNVPLVGGILSAPFKGIGSLVNTMFGSKINEDFVNQTKNNINSQYNYNSNATDNNQLLSEWESFKLLDSVDQDEVGSDGWFSNKAKNLTSELNEDIIKANNRALASIGNNAENISKQNIFNNLVNYSAYGGPINMLYSGPMSPFGNTFGEGGGIHIKKKNRGKFTDYCGGKVTSECIQRGLHSSNPTTRKRANFARNARKWHSFGGWLNTQGGDFTNGITYIDNGGTHEQNPNEGVQMGVDKQGIPNLVEEGEVIFNDYVFSNRIKVPKELKNKYKIHGNTFAEAAKELSKESEERPNDPISKRGLNSFMNILADSQEELRIHKSMRESNKYKKGGRLFAYAGSLESPYSYGNELLNKSNIDTTPYYRSGSDYMNKYNYILNNWDSPYVQSFIKDVYIPLVESYNKSRGYNTSFTVNRDQFKAGAHDNQWGGMHEGVLKFEIPESGNTPSLLDIKDVESLLDLNDDIPELNPTISDLRRGTSSKSKVKNIRQNPLRYAPIVGSGIAVLNDLLGGNKPDYSNAGLFSQAIDNSYNPIGYRPLGDYLVYKPFDRDYYINKLNADSAASRRAIQNTSGGNRAAQMAGILASNYNYGNQLGSLARQAEEYNMAQRERVRTFNRATNMFNSEQGTKIDMFNAEGAGKKAALYGKLAEMRQRILDANRAEKSLNLTNFLQGLGDLGRELTDRDIIRWMGDTGTLSYNTKGEYTGGSKKNGGKLKRKKGFTV